VANSPIYMPVNTCFACCSQFKSIAKQTMCISTSSAFELINGAGSAKTKVSGLYTAVESDDRMVYVDIICLWQCSPRMASPFLKMPNLPQYVVGPYAPAAALYKQ
jgi:hypothetical protein